MIWLIATLALALLVLVGGPRFLRPRRPDPPAADPEAGGPAPDYDVEIDSELDLHGVPERDVDGLVDAFVEVARARGLVEVKIIHGKGTGRRRARVRERLAAHPEVLGFGDAATPGSGWGATIVRLRSGVAPPGGPV